MTQRTVNTKRRYEMVKDQIKRIAVPSLGQDLESIVSAHFGESPYFMLVTLNDGQIQKNEAIRIPHGNCFSIIDSLARESVSTLLVTNIGARPYLVAQSRDIDVRKVSTDGTIKKAIESYLKGETKPFKGIDICSGKECH
jgi:predicted Fe-Mo cluster-binding NifX family protein